MALAGQYVWFTRALYAVAQAHVELRGFVDVVASTVVCEVPKLSSQFWSDSLY